MDSEDHDIEIQRGELIVEAGDGEFCVGLLDIPAVFIGIRLGMSTYYIVIDAWVHDHWVLFQRLSPYMTMLCSKMDSVKASSRTKGFFLGSNHRQTYKIPN